MTFLTKLSFCATLISIVFQAQSSQGSVMRMKSPHAPRAGGCKNNWPKMTGTVTLSAPQQVTSSFDCRNKLYKRKGGHVFVLTQGASLSNCYFQQTGTDDGVHIKGAGTFTLTNLYFLSTGDDGISIKDGNSNVNIVGGGFLQAGNKAVQHNGQGTVTLRGGCYENVHILAKSCGNCKQNSAVKGRTLKIENCSISNVRTVCGVNSNRADVCTVKGLKGTPTESVCTAYQGITDPSTLPKQTSKNKKNKSCVF